MRKAFSHTHGYRIIRDWMKMKARTPFTFQLKTWERYGYGYSGMVIAPTGFGKTFSVFLGVLIDFMNHPDAYSDGLKLLWVTPLRALAKDLAKRIEKLQRDNLKPVLKKR